MSDVETNATDNNANSSGSNASSSSVESGSQSKETPKVNEGKQESASLKDTVREAFKEVRERNEKTDKQVKDNTETGKRRVEGADSKPETPAEQTTPNDVKPEQKSDPTHTNIDPMTGKELPDVKAPNSLTPALREKWKQVPREFQEFWSKREQQVAETISKNDKARKFTDEMLDAGRVFSPMLKQRNLSLGQYTKQVFSELYTLQNGTPQQKATILGNLILAHRPDKAALETVLKAGHPFNIPGTKPQPKPDFDQAVKAEIDKREKERVSTEAKAVINSFMNDPANEFARDVERAMEHAIEGGLVNGNTHQELLKNAYDFALRNHPEISKIISARTPVSKDQSVPDTGIQPVRSAKPALGTGRASKTPAKEYKSIKEAARDALKEIRARGQ